MVLYEVADNSIDAQFNLIDVYVELPTSDADDRVKIQARPVEFDEDGSASKYITLCPICSQTIMLGIGDIKVVDGNRFVECHSCGIGCEVEVPEFIDPFVNPVSTGKIKDNELDHKLIDILHDDDDDDDDIETIAKKLEL